MIKKKRIAKGLSLFMAMALCAGNITPVTVKAEPATEERNILLRTEKTGQGLKM